MSAKFLRPNETCRADRCAALRSFVMNMPTSSQQKPDYGIDAPPVILTLLLIAVAALAVALVLHFLEVPHPGGIPVREIALIFGLNFLLSAGGMVYYSKVRKVRARERLLDLIPWRGDEVVLDVGCGRGLLLIGAARRMTTGRGGGGGMWAGGDVWGSSTEER